MGTARGVEDGSVSVPDESGHQKSFGAVGQEVTGVCHRGQCGSPSRGRGEKGSRLQP